MRKVKCKLLKDTIPDFNKICGILWTFKNQALLEKKSGKDSRATNFNGCIPYRI
jgi:hypothetical protein